MEGAAKARPVFVALPALLFGVVSSVHEMIELLPSKVKSTADDVVVRGRPPPA